MSSENYMFIGDVFMGKKRRGHYCVGCDRYRANEKFSGKGHRKHICKDCQKTRRQRQNSKNGNSPKQWDTAFESDDNFAYIEDYTEGSFPFGITYDEWDELEHFENDPYNEHVYITIPLEIAEKLKHISSEKSLKNAIYHSITLSLFIADEISMERAAYLLNYNFADFIHILESKRIPWSIGERDGYNQYKQSINDLLVQVDQIEDDLKMWVNK